MPTSIPPPTEADVLKAIASILTAKRSSAALSHYPTLRVQTRNLVEAIKDAIACVENITQEWSEKLGKDSEVAYEFTTAGTPKYFYRTIAPILVRNIHQTADFLLEETRPAPKVGMDELSEIIPSFSSFIRLGGAVRGFLDVLVQAAYQLTTFDGLQLNYKFLQSLLSFAVVAPESLHANIASSEIQAALDAYTSLSKKEQKNSSFTKSAYEQFPQRLQVASELARLPEHQRQNLELLFGFCSDFVHSGYVTVLAIGGKNPEVVMGSRGDVFTPKAENFAELKLRLLSECAGAYAELLVPVLKHAMAKTLAGGIPTDWEKELDAAATTVQQLREILYRRLVEPVRKGSISSGASLEVECICGGAVKLGPPHHEWDRFCPDCGSRFELLELSDEVDYVISQKGPGDVLGGDATKIANLSADAKAKLKRLSAKHRPQDSSESANFVLITDLDRCDEESLEVPSMCTRAANELDKKRCSLLAFVAEKSFARCSVVRITCNCGTLVDYQTNEGNCICQCQSCLRFIGLIGMSGNVSSVVIRNPDGTPGHAPIQARNRFSLPGIAIDYP